MRLPDDRLRGRLIAWALGALLALMACDARALCTTVCSCAVSTTNVVFGAVNPLSLTATDSVGSINVTCGGVAGLLIPVQVDISKGGGTSFASRSMASGANRLAYNLYTDSARSMVFGDTTNGTTDASGSISLNVLGIGPPFSANIYGRVFGGQLTTVPGNYADTIAVTLTYY